MNGLINKKNAESCYFISIEAFKDKYIEATTFWNNKNTKGIETNLTNVGKMKQAITPDK